GDRDRIGPRPVREDPRQRRTPPRPPARPPGPCARGAHRPAARGRGLRRRRRPRRAGHGDPAGEPADGRGHAGRRPAGRRDRHPARRAGLPGRRRPAPGLAPQTAPGRQPPPGRAEPRLRPLGPAMIGLVSVTKAGHAAAGRLAAWPDTQTYDGPAAEALPRAFAECDAVVCFLAVGATVRLLAPLLTTKHDDPAVVCVDEALRFAVPVLGAHSGGGNELARRVAAALGAEPVVTTASDAAGGAGLDDFGADLGFTIEPGSDLGAVGTGILSGERVTFTTDAEWPLPPLPPNVVRTDRPEPGVPAVVVTDQKINWNERGAFSWPPFLRGGVGASRGVVFRPPSLRVGVGASRGAPAGEIGQLIDGVLGELGVSHDSVRYLATVDAKADEPGLQSAAAMRGWSVRTFPASRLAAVPVPNPSEVVRRAVG